MKKVISGLVFASTLLAGNAFSATVNFDATCVTKLPTVAAAGAPMSPAQAYDQFMNNTLGDPTVISFVQIRGLVSEFVGKLAPADLAAVNQYTDSLQYNLGCGFATGAFTRDGLMAWAGQLLNLVTDSSAASAAKVLPTVKSIYQSATGAEASASDATCVTTLSTTAVAPLPLSQAQFYHQFLTNEILNDATVISFKEIKVLVNDYVTKLAPNDLAAVNYYVDALQYKLGCGFATQKVSRDTLMGWAGQILTVLTETNPTSAANMLPTVRSVYEQAAAAGL